MFSNFSSLTVDAFLSGSGRDKAKGPDPKINITVHPQQNVIIPVDSFVWLHCVANSTSTDSEYDYMNDDPMAMDEIQFLAPSDDDFLQNDSPNDNSMPLGNDFSGYSCKQEVQYQWFHNGQAVDSSIAQAFCNGTIKIKYTPSAEGVYRCLAETTVADDGAVISKTATVKLAGMYINFQNTLTKNLIFLFQFV